MIAAFDWSTIVDKAADWGIRILGVLIALWLSFKIARWLANKITGTLKKRNFDETLSIFFGNATRYLILTGAVLACLSIFGIQTTTFAAVIGAASLAIGLAFQGTLANFAAGVLLLVFRPFKVGDLVNAAGQLGVVKEIGLFTITMDTLDNRRIIIPNKHVSGGIIENIGHNEKRRVDIKVGVDYGADIAETRKVLEAVAEKVEGRDPEKGHQVIVTGLGDSAVDWQVRVWCNTADYWAVWEATIHDTKKGLEAANIGIPFPQMDVHLDGSLSR